MKHYVVMVAGGTGTRMRQTTAKQFLNVEGLPLMWWTLRRFKEALPEAEITLVLHESLFDQFAALEAEHAYNWTTATDKYPTAPVGDALAVSVTMQKKYASYFSSC